MPSLFTSRFTPVARVLVLSLLFMAPVCAAAQLAPPGPLDDTTSTRIHIRGFSANPTIALTNVGVDSNVFNEVDNPKQDVTMTLSPALNTWVRAGRAQFALHGQSDLVYFQKYSSERSVDGGVAARLQIPLNRLSPWIDGGFFSGRQRVGYELDARSRRRIDSVGLGLSYRVAPKTTLNIGAHRDDIRWDGDSLFFGQSLRDSLNHRSESIRLEYRQALTALTTFVAESTASRDRFTYTATRNTNSVEGLFGFDLKTRALISGNGRIGLSRFEAVEGGFDSFQGLVARANLSYTFRGMTQVAVQTDRNTSYSFDINYPYYVQTGAVGTVTQHLVAGWDIQARAGRYNLAYRTRADAIDALPSRVDRIGQFGGGLGYRLNPKVRLGFNLDKNRRTSIIQRREYNAFKFGASVTYAQ